MAPDPSEYMRKTIDMAIENVSESGGGPFACMIVRGEEIIATGVNQVTAHNDPTAHAEVIAIRRACRVLKDFQLKGMDIYTTCEPCPMCLGAIYWARLDRIFYAASRYDASEIGFDDEVIYREISLPPDERRILTNQLLQDEARKIFKIWLENPDRLLY